MLYFLLYKIGQLIVLILPLKAGYRLACWVADIHYRLSKRDRQIIINNLKVVLKRDERKINYYAREVFRNFGKYLVDFLRFSKLDRRFIEERIKIEGKEYFDEALRTGKGVVILSAHLGNWELAGAVAAMLGYPLNIVAWVHKNRRVNNLFLRQRTNKGIKVIPPGISVKKCFSVLRNNEMVGLVGDIDFANPDHGISINFFGKRALLPKGPATLSLKTGACIIPVFMVREEKDFFKFIINRPIEYNATGNFEEDLKNLTQRISEVLESFISRYPSQWSIFSEIWRD